MKDIYPCLAFWIERQHFRSLLGHTFLAPSKGIAPLERYSAAFCVLCTNFRMSFDFNVLMKAHLHCGFDEWETYRSFRMVFARGESAPSDQRRLHGTWSSAMPWIGLIEPSRVLPCTVPPIDGQAEVDTTSVCSVCMHRSLVLTTEEFLLVLIFRREVQRAIPQ